MIDFISNLLQISFPWVIFLFMILTLGAQLIPIFPGGVVIWLLALLFGIITPTGFAGIGAFYFTIVMV
jgi:hypothetical protein